MMALQTFLFPIYPRPAQYNLHLYNVLYVHAPLANWVINSLPTHQYPESPEQHTSRHMGGIVLEVSLWAYFWGTILMRLIDMRRPAPEEDGTNARARVMDWLERRKLTHQEDLWVPPFWQSISRDQLLQSSIARTCLSSQMVPWNYETEYTIYPLRCFRQVVFITQT